MTYVRSLSSIYTNSDVAKNDFLNTGGTTTGDYFALIDESISGANDADYLRGSSAGNDVVVTSGTPTESYVANISDMPSDFVSIVSLSYNIRYRVFNRTDDTAGLQLVITNSSYTSALTNVATITNITNTTFTNSGVINFTLTTAGTNATKETWDSARLQIGQTYTTSMASDNGYVAISALEITGTYNAYRPELKYYNGSTWLWKPLFVYIGGQWVYKTLKRWDGTQWVREPD